MGDEKVILEAGDTLVVAPYVAHHATNIGNENADMIVAYSSGERDFHLEKDG
jgi:mannose-6-phosphate isomerase-like protein (cupin superfamily)